MKSLGTELGIERMTEEEEGKTRKGDYPAEKHGMEKKFSGCFYLSRHISWAMANTPLFSSD